MQGYARMLVIGGIVAVLALAAVAFAVAETGPGGDTPARDDSPVQATDAARPTAPAATDAPVVGSPEDDGAGDDDGEQAENEQLDGADDVERTTALNPAGHCVALPDTSDVIQHPDKHANWTIADCEPASDADDAPDADEPDDDGDAEKVPAINPGGVCTEISADSDVVRHPEEHPGWTLGECD